MTIRSAEQDAAPRLFSAVLKWRGDARAIPQALRLDKCRQTGLETEAGVVIT
jgi:hypothetical protein